MSRIIQQGFDVSAVKMRLLVRRIWPQSGVLHARQDVSTRTGTRTRTRKGKVQCIMVGGTGANGADRG